MKFKLFFISLSALLMVSCKSTYHYAVSPDAHLEDFSNLTFAGSYVDYGYIEHGSDPVPDDSISILAAEQVGDVLQSRDALFSMGCVDTLFVWGEPELTGELTRWNGVSVCDRIFIDPKAFGLDDCPGRYALLYYSTGFTRRRGNYVGHVVGSVAISFFASLFTNSTVEVDMPVKFSTAHGAMIVDARTGEVMYNYMYRAESDPLDRRSHHECFTKVLEHYRNSVRYVDRRDNKR